MRGDAARATRNRNRRSSPLNWRGGCRFRAANFLRAEKGAFIVMENTILVTGGAGFIGSNFILHWLERETGKVVNLDKLTYAGNPRNLQRIFTNPHYAFVLGDICDRKLVAECLRHHKPRAIVHFAAESHVDRSILGPDDFVRTNLNGTFSLLEGARAYWSNLKASEQGKFRFLQVSTDEVYGSLGEHDPAFTELTAYAPNSPYSASKAAANHLVRAYHHTYQLPTLTTNCSNNYGPFQFPEKLIPLLLSFEHQPLGHQSSEVEVDQCASELDCNLIDLPDKQTLYVVWVSLWSARPGVRLFDFRFEPPWRDHGFVGLPKFADSHVGVYYCLPGGLEYPREDVLNVNFGKAGWRLSSTRVEGVLCALSNTPIPEEYPHGATIPVAVTFFDRAGRQLAEATVTLWADRLTHCRQKAQQTSNAAAESGIGQPPRSSLYDPAGGDLLPTPDWEQKKGVPLARKVREGSHGTGLYRD